MSNSLLERITVSGFGGQGVMLVGQLLAYAGNAKGKETLWFPSYGPETRGGTANCAVTISDSAINSPVFSKANTVIAMNEPSLIKFASKVRDDGYIFYNSSLGTSEKLNLKAKVYNIPVNDLAVELNNIRVANMIILGAYLEVSNLFTDDEVLNVLKTLFGPERSHLIEINKTALQVGRNYIKNNY